MFQLLVISDCFYFFSGYILLLSLSLSHLKLYYIAHSFILNNHFNFVTFQFFDFTVPIYFHITQIYFTEYLSLFKFLF